MTKDYILNGQMTWSDLNSQYGKMSQGHSVQIPAMTSQRSWKCLSVSKKRDFLCLDLTEDGLTQDALLEKIGVSHGELWMLNIGEYPNEERESHLSWILQGGVPDKYSLSPKACQGILTRASRRGKELPDVLKRALENVIAQHLNSVTQDQIQVGGVQGH